MESAIILHGVSLENFNAVISDLKSQIKDLKENFQPVVPTELLSRSEVAKMLSIDLSSVHNWTVKGKLQSYGIGGRVYYKRSEVEEALIPLNKVQSRQ